MLQLHEEVIEKSFGPLHPGITKRHAFMHRIQKATGTPPPEQIHITLESSGAHVTACFVLHLWRLIKTICYHSLSPNSRTWM
jgi:hypothetical protein